MTDSLTFDLFDGLPLDYTFLEGGGDDSVSESKNAGGANGDPNLTSVARSFVMPDDQMLLDSDVPSSSPTNMMASKSESEDLLSPLSFVFNSNGTLTEGTSYRVAPQHKHKRVRSNPDVLQGFSMANMAPSVITPPIMGHNRMIFSQHHTMTSLGSVPQEPMTNLMHLVDTPTLQDDSFQEMDEFLKEMSWSELNSEEQQQYVPDLTTPDRNNSSSFVEASPVAYRSQRIQHEVNELKLKRKRPANHHSRHHSNPVDLLHNLDQFRVLAQQNKQQQMQMQVQQSSQKIIPDTFKTLQDSTNFFVPPQVSTHHSQFQVPPQIASGAAHSLHSRRSSLGSNLPPRAAARRRGANRSSGLSMDMSQMNLNFLSVPEDASMIDINTQRSPPRHSASSSASSSGTKNLSVDEMNRKMYKCGRCGQPKVGHVCTMPDQRNNWTQADLEVTKGLKIMRVNCHIITVKSKWMVRCDDHEPPQLPNKVEIKSEEEVEAEPSGL
ncbi:uncharacterized protein PHALS_12052 [Plasmopara halstedii]|uniref:Uncharacterized protein n=1 Tax=Plasmopara halstedii TaxID=4781 RepID=A0A0P1ALE0_PLAHL|nr:uncharacterized protein PHALS_12052 [Plasmopara halstedii]CEG41721.1 hypothetical protein PHALS_12052 [Plasmopara halstedii]|eukprot:XP_024578090.1 hypothetical protein PHALS_12052 [Plasmopara halstedii]